MIDTKIFLEKFLQKYRFNKVKKFLYGDILDFGGNEGELKQFIPKASTYTLVNYDHSPMENKTFDTIVALAVIEHIEVDEVYNIFKKFKKILRRNGVIFLTTPTPKAHPVLMFLASLNLLDRSNLEEHKHYWTKEEIYELAKSTGFYVEKYKKFQFGFNQYAILKHKES